MCIAFVYSRIVFYIAPSGIYIEHGSVCVGGPLHSLTKTVSRLMHSKVGERSSRVSLINNQSDKGTPLYYSSQQRALHLTRGAHLIAYYQQMLLTLM